jgi:hypothetical protein
LLFFTRGEFPSRSVNRDAGLDHLRQLLLEAHREYQDYVVTGAMSPRVFAVQFLAGHHHYGEAGTADEKNLHRKALGAVGILLLERADLVKQFFSKLSLEGHDIDKIIVLVYTERRDDELTESYPEKTAPTKRVQEMKLSCTIRTEDMPLLADCANEAGFFHKKVTAQEMNDLVQGTLTTPLVAANLMGIAYFFDCLSAMDLISHRWQTVLEHNGSILLQGKNKPQSRSNYSSALNRARSNGFFSYKNDIDILMTHIRKKYIP